MKRTRLFLQSDWIYDICIISLNIGQTVLRNSITKPFLTIKFVSHLVPIGGSAHYSKAASRLHIHDLSTFHMVNGEGAPSGGGRPQQQQTCDKQFHF